MKISKLFHWLYALLMLLPAFFVGGRMAYTIFNKNAKDSYSGANGYSIKYKWETNEVTSIDDLKVGNIYKMDLSANIYPIGSSGYTSLIYGYNFYFFEVNNNNLLASYASDNNSLLLLSINNGNGNLYIQSLGNSQTFVTALNSDNHFCYVVFSSLTSSSTLTYENFSISDYNEIADVTISNVGTLDNAFDYSMSQLNDLPLFSWAKDSFIVQPFSYITGLFGIPSDSPVLTLLSYWCSISLIWLTFDLLMYVPLLVHRWLDKGVLE